MNIAMHVGREIKRPHVFSRRHELSAPPAHVQAVPPLATVIVLIAVLSNSCDADDQRHDDCRGDDDLTRVTSKAPVPIVGSGADWNGEHQGGADGGAPSRRAKLRDDLTIRHAADGMRGVGVVLEASDTFGKKIRDPDEVRLFALGAARVAQIVLDLIGVELFWLSILSCFAG